MTVSYCKPLFTRKIMTCTLAIRREIFRHKDCRINLGMLLSYIVNNGSRQRLTLAKVNREISYVW